MCCYFLIFAQNIDFEYTLEPPRGGGPNKYSQSMFSDAWASSVDLAVKHVNVIPGVVFALGKLSCAHVFT